MKITIQTKIPFSRYKGTRLRDLPDGFLNWMTKTLPNTDFHDWAKAAEEELERRQRENSSVQDLEQQADSLLRDAGFDPRKL